MTRFNDEWLIDKTLFDYTMGGGCACCSFNFLPNGITGLIQDSMQSELETDAIQDEVNSLDILPWPVDLKNQVWMERVRLRQLLKKDMIPTYKEFFNVHGEGYKQWLYNEVTPRRMFNIFQLSRTELQNYWNKESKYNIHAAFGTVLCGVIEQIAYFHMTGYPTDGRGKLIINDDKSISGQNDEENNNNGQVITGEVEFENILKFDKRCGFTLKDLLIEKQDDTTGEMTKQVNKDVLDIWIIRHESLCGPKLLDRNYKKKKKIDGDEDGEGDGDDDNDDDEGGDDAAANGNQAKSSQAVIESKTKASFRADRRIVRLVIARIWANNLQAAYLKDMKLQQKQEQVKDEKEVKEEKVEE